MLQKLAKWTRNFYWISSIMKTHIIYCVSAQIPCLIKFLFLGYGPKCSQPIRLQNFLINHISKTNQWNFDFLNVDTNSCQLKVDLIIFGWAWWEVSMDEISIEWIDRMNWYFACWCKFTLQSYFGSPGALILGWVWSEMGMVIEIMRP